MHRFFDNVHFIITIYMRARQTIIWVTNGQLSAI